MDLNAQYTRHQRAVMSATATSCAAQRHNLLAKAARIAGSIATYQNRLGAPAAAGWSAAL